MSPNLNSLALIHGALCSLLATLKGLLADFESEGTKAGQIKAKVLYRLAESAMFQIEQVESQAKAHGAGLKYAGHDVSVVVDKEGFAEGGIVHDKSNCYPGETPPETIPSRRVPKEFKIGPDGKGNAPMAWGQVLFNGIPTLDRSWKCEDTLPPLGYCESKLTEGKSSREK